MRIVGWIPVNPQYVGRHRVWTGNGWQEMDLWQWQWMPVWSW